MGFFKYFNFTTFKHKDVIEKDFLDAQTDKILSELDQEYRFKEVNSLSYPNREIRTNLLYAATTLWKEVVNASHALYKKIQILEADYSEVKNKLDNKLYYELENLENERSSLKDDIEQNSKELDRLQEEKTKVETEFHELSEEKKVKGELTKLPFWVFLAIMGSVGFAELFIYEKVFLSQEIQLQANMLAQEKFQVTAMAITMALGFTLMIIWLAHAFGKLLRYFPNVPKSESWFYLLKMGVIIAAVSSAIYATVEIRAEMYTILAKDQKVADIKNKMDDSSDLFSDTTESSAQPQEDSEDLFGESDAQEPAKPSVQKNKKEQLAQQKDMLTDEINEDKGKTAPLFLFINIFIFIGGVFLAYASHTSSFVYDKIVSDIEAAYKRDKKLKRLLYDQDKRIMNFKDDEIDKLFTKLLYKAAMYDKEVRTYNTYIQIFELKLELIENYIKTVYETNKIEYDPISYKDILDESINLDRRSELQHVHKNLEEYLIYKFDKNFKEGQI